MFTEICIKVTKIMNTGNLKFLLIKSKTFGKLFPIVMEITSTHIYFVTNTLLETKYFGK